MKKLALALVCLVSVAFFASCDPEDIIQDKQPSIEILTGEGYLQNGDVVDMYEVRDYGFRCASNPNTQAELARFVITSTISTGEADEEPIVEEVCDSLISGTEFTYYGEVYYEWAEKDIVAFAEITATVYDVDGNSNKVSLKIDINESEELTPVDFTWNRHGGQPATGNLAELGLEWKINAKEIYAVITPMEGATLYRFDDETGRDIWGSVVTASDKAALFSEGHEAIEDLREVSCTAPEKEYNIVIGTIYNGQTNLIHITKSTVFTFKGTDVTINGQYK